MKKGVFILLVFLLVSCTNNKTFDSSKLRGKYKVDITPLVEENTKSNDELFNGLLKMALSSIKIEMNFYENNKGVIHIDAGLFSGFIDSKKNNATF